MFIHRNVHKMNAICVQNHPGQIMLPRGHLFFGVQPHLCRFLCKFCVPQCYVINACWLAINSSKKLCTTNYFFCAMAGSPGHIAKAALFVYFQWEREWVTCMQKNDQRMTYSMWLWAFIQVTERFSCCSTTYLNATCVWTNASSMPVDGAKPDSSSHWPSCPAVESQNNWFMYFLLKLCFFIVKMMQLRLVEDLPPLAF